jgi:hypothetical protein
MEADEVAAPGEEEEQMERWEWHETKAAPDQTDDNTLLTKSWERKAATGFGVMKAAGRDERREGDGW